MHYIYAQYETRTNLLPLVPDLDVLAVGTGLGNFEVPFSAGGDAEVAKAALLALVQQRALARGAQRRGAAARRAAPRPRHRRARLAPRGLVGQVQSVHTFKQMLHAGLDFL